MKILFISSDNSRTSGAFLSMVSLNEHLQKYYGCQTCVILPKDGNGTELLDEKGIEHIIVRSYSWIVRTDEKRKIITKLKNVAKRFLNVKAAREISKIIRDGKYDIVHINTIYTYAGALAAIEEKVPLLWHVREMPELGQNKTFSNKNYSCKLINKSDCIIPISKSVYNYYSKYGFDTRKMRIAYNGVDEKRFFKEDKEIFSSDIPTILFVGGFNKTKGAYTLCDALEEIYDEVDYKIDFVGEPPEQFVEYVEKMKIANRAVFHGYQKQVEDFYEKADIVVNGSKAEAFGRTTAEAMLSGCLVIGTKDGGTSELILHNKTGLAFTFGRAKELSKQIKHALENKDKMIEIAKAGRQHVKQNMTSMTNAKRVHSLYEYVLKNKAVHNENKIVA